MSDTPELNVWRDACDLSSYRPLPNASTPDTLAAAVIRSYGDQRDASARSEGHAEGYAQAVADVVAWLGGNASLRDGGKWESDWIEADAIRECAKEITRRFGKDHDHG